MRSIRKDLGIRFLCDRRACEICIYPECAHTWDIDHAVSFFKDRNGMLFEHDNVLIEEDEDDYTIGKE